MKKTKFFALLLIVSMFFNSITTIAATSEKPPADNTVYSSMIPSQNSTDPQWQSICQEDDYIIQLINSFGENTDRSNWKFNLEYLKFNIDSIKQLPDVNIYYINDYIQAYDLVTLNEAMGNSRQNISPRVAYSPTDAVTYAQTYYKNYNPNYPDWSSLGGDCANFVSQCLYAGGKSMVGSGGDATNFANWFSSGKTQNTSLVSSTWRGADAFRNF